MSVLFSRLFKGCIACDGVSGVMGNGGLEVYGAIQSILIIVIVVCVVSDVKTGVVITG